MALWFRGARKDQSSQPACTQTVALVGRTKAIPVLASVPNLSLSKSSLNFRINIRFKNEVFSWSYYLIKINGKIYILVLFFQASYQASPQINEFFPLFSVFYTS